MRKALIILAIIGLVASTGHALEAWERPLSNQAQYEALVSYYQNRANYYLGACNLAATTVVMAMLANDSAAGATAINNMTEAADLAIAEVGYANYYMGLIQLTALGRARMADDQAELAERLDAIVRQVEGLKR